MSSKLEVIHQNWPDRTYPEFGVRVEEVGQVELCELTRKYGFLLTKSAGDTSIFPAGWGPVPRPGIFWHFPHSDGDGSMVSVLWCSSDKVYDGRSTGVVGMDLGVTAILKNIHILREMQLSSAAQAEIDFAEECLRKFQADSKEMPLALTQLQNLRSLLGRFEKSGNKPREFMRAVVADSKVHEHVWEKGHVMAVSSKVLHCRMNGTDYDALRVADFHG